MVRFLHLRLPIRTLLLAASEGSVAAMLMLGVTVPTHRPAWIWLRYEGGILRVGIAAGIFFLCLYYHNLYDSLVLKSLRDTLTRLPEVLGTVYLALAGIYMIAPSLRLSLASVLLGVALSGLAIAFVRHAYAVITRSSRFAELFALVGTGQLAQALQTEIQNRPEFGIQLTVAPSIWSLYSVNLPSRTPEKSMGLILARDEGEILLENESARRVILNGIDLYETLTGKLWLKSLEDHQLRAAQPAAVSAIHQLTKRAASLAFSLFLLLLTFPVMAILALTVWLDSGSPVIFRQQRVGQHGQPFTLYKFRSMQNGHHGPFRPTAPGDERCTRVGRWLRRTRLDELPQLWNILRGDMAFIGPRPFAWQEEHMWARTIPFYRLRWAVKPGATGWAQVHRGYCATLQDNVEKLAYDLFYIKNLSVGLDLLILFQTTKILLQGRGAR